MYRKQTNKRFRELGRIKGGRKQFEDQVDVADVPLHELTDDDKETRNKFWEHPDAQASPRLYCFVVCYIAFMWLRLASRVALAIAMH